MSVCPECTNYSDITVHGFRSTFRDWASEQTSFPHETCEHAHAHRISDKAEAAYRRGDQFKKRRKLMEAWAEFCELQPRGNVVPLRGAPAWLISPAALGQANEADRKFHRLSHKPWFK